MSDTTYRTEDRSAIRSGAEALQRAQEEVSNITFEGHPDVRDRITSLLNTVGQSFGDLGERLDGESKDRKVGETDESGRVVTEDQVRPSEQDRNAKARR